MSTGKSDSFGSKDTLKVGGDSYTFWRLAKAADGRALERLPFSLRVLLENLLRHEDGRVVKREHIEARA